MSLLDLLHSHGQKLDEGVKELNSFVEGHNLSIVIEQFGCNLITKAMASAFINSENDQTIYLITKCILEMCIENKSAIDHLLQTNFLTIVFSKISSHEKYCEAVSNIISMLYPQAKKKIQSYGLEILVRNIATFTEESTKSALETSLDILQSTSPSQHISALQYLYPILSTYDRPILEYAVFISVEIMEAIHISDIPDSVFKDLVSSIKKVTDVNVHCKLFKFLAQSLDYKPLFYSITASDIKFYEYATNAELREDALQILLSLFPKSEFPTNVSMRVSPFGVRDNHFAMEAAPFLKELYVKNPRNAFTICTYAMSLKYRKPDEDNNLVQALKISSKEKDLIVYCLIITSYLTDLTGCAKYGVMSSLEKSPLFKEPFYQKIYKPLMRRCPEIEEIDAALASDSILDIVDFIADCSPSYDVVSERGILERSKELIQTTDVDGDELWPLINLCFSYLQMIKFETQNFGNIRTLNDFKIHINLKEGNQVVTKKLRIALPLANLEGLYNLNSVRGSKQGLIDAINVNKNLSSLLLQEEVNLNDPTLFSLLSRAFGNKNYVKCSFKACNKIYSVHQNLTHIVADSFNESTNLSKLVLNIELVTKDSERPETVVPFPIVSKPLQDVLDLLKIIHEKYPRLRLYESQFAKIPAGNIVSPFAVCLGRVTEIQFMYHYPFLFPFSERIFVSHLLGVSPEDVAHVFEAKFLDPNMLNSLRLRVMVDRTKLLENGIDILEAVGNSHISIGAAFQNEPGFGRGPTQEFFSALSAHFAAKPMWNSNYFPRPDCHPEDMWALGLLFGKAFQQQKFVDIHISPAFFNLVLGRPVTIESVDATIARSLGFTDGLIGLDFTYPGLPDFAMVPKGKDLEVTAENVSEYVSKVKEFTIGNPIIKLANAFKTGFERSAPINVLAVFEGSEIDRVLCGERASFNPDDVKRGIKAEHGYGPQSREIKWLSHILLTMSPEDQRAFVRFVTGSERLPSGGLPALRPPLTVAKRGGDDASFPTVSTCANYFKLPAYSCEDVMRERIITAIHEEASFGLS